jgi:hypothetical protein
MRSLGNVFALLSKVLKLKQSDRRTLRENRVVSETLKEILGDFNKEIEARRILKLTQKEKRFD